MTEPTSAEIERAANEHADESPMSTNGGFVHYCECASFREGAKWAIEQMKKSENEKSANAEFLESLGY